MKDFLNYKVGMIGNPIFPLDEWTDELLTDIKELGFNYLQLNIAWDNRPNGEALNLEHVQGETLSKLKTRVQNAKKFGIKCLPHFGMPTVKTLLHEANITPYLTPSCISDERVLEHNIKLATDLLKNLPDIDDVMFYTYDQHAWLCSEFGYCPKCNGIPLDKRLVPFIEKIKSEMAKVNKNVKFWWQPWELSLGQICEVLQQINTDNFGLMLNTGGNESYYNNLDNYWVKCIGRIAEERNIPIIAEIQATGSGVGSVPLQFFQCPTLVHRQIGIMRQFPTLVGIKEHFGYVKDKQSVNTLFLKEFFKSADSDLDILLERTAQNYTDDKVKELVKLWKDIEKAYDFIPFNFTYLYTNIAGYSPKHTYNVENPLSVQADTPAWESDRKGFYISLHNDRMHPWAIENAALLFKQAGNRLNDIYLKLCSFKNVKRSEDFEQSQNDIKTISKACLGQYYYLAEILCAYDVRSAMLSGNEQKINYELSRFDELLKGDIENLDNDEEIVKKYKEFKDDYLLFFDCNFRQNEKYWTTPYIDKMDQRY